MVEMRTKVTAWRALALGDEGRIQHLSSNTFIIYVKAGASETEHL
jgi:hypothetical protein